MSVAAAADPAVRESADSVERESLVRSVRSPRESGLWLVAETG